MNKSLLKSVEEELHQRGHETYLENEEVHDEGGGGGDEMQQNKSFTVRPNMPRPTKPKMDVGPQENFADDNYNQGTMMHFNATESPCRPFTSSTPRPPPPKLPSNNQTSSLGKEPDHDRQDEEDVSWDT